MRACALLLAIFVLCGGTAAAAPAFPDPAIQLSTMKRGLDVAWLPPWTPPAAPQIEPRHFAAIKAAGFDTVQLVLSPLAHMGPDRTLERDWLARLDGLTKAALANGLKVILLEHDDAGCAKDRGLCRQKIDAFWRQIGAWYRDAPPEVLFAVPFEPDAAFSAQEWNGELRRTLAVIRQTNPARNVLVGVQVREGRDAIEAFELPASDRHLIAVAHYFQPLSFTHQGADWEPAGRGRRNVAWGSAEERAALARDFALYRQWSISHGRPVYLGAFGAFETAPPADRLQWIAAVARAAEANGIGWAFWQFDTNFNVYDLAKDTWIAPVRNVLIPPAN